VVLFAAGFLPATPARGDSQADVQAQVDRLGSEMSILDEQYNQATIRLVKVESQVRDATASVARTQADRASLQKAASAQAAAIYKAGAPQILVALLSSTSLKDFNQRMVTVSQVNAWQSAIMTSLQIASERAKEAQSDLNGELAVAKSINDKLAGQRKDLQNKLSQERHLLSKISEANRQAAEREAAARAQAAQAAAASRVQVAQAPARPQATQNAAASGGAPPTPKEVPSSGGATTAVQVALAQVGKPYVWAGAGPDVFDCSGLTLYAWRAAGVSLSHSAADQYASLPHVSSDQLQPGDLVFFGSPIHHEGMYLGGGMMVNAPQTGENVRVVPIDRSDFVGASRPGA
jgi:cell wall-associated NlpC family hydrolase